MKNHGHQCELGVWMVLSLVFNVLHIAQRFTFIYSAWM